MKKATGGKTLTPTQIERGKEAISKIRSMFSYAASRFTALVGFYRYLSSRHRAVIYFMAGIKKDRHAVSYEELTGTEQQAVDNAMEEMASIVDSYRQTVRKYRHTDNQGH